MRIILLTFLSFIAVIPAVLALEVAPDGPLIINLRQDAGSVIIGNPAHATVAMQNSRMLIVNAGLPGVTNLTVLDERGNVIFNEKLVVNSSTDGYVRVKNACINAEGDCQPYNMFYCIEGSACHDVVVATEEPTPTVGLESVQAFNDFGGDEDDFNDSAFEADEFEE